MKAAVMIGHDDIFGLDQKELEKRIVFWIEKGVRDFYSGGQGGFDRIAACTVFSLKKRYPMIRNILVIPYLSFRIFDASVFDEVIYPDSLTHLHFKAAIIKRNRYMVDKAQVAICFVRYAWGKSAKTLEYAKKRNCLIENLAETTDSNS